MIRAYQATWLGADGTPRQASIEADHADDVIPKLRQMGVSGEIIVGPGFPIMDWQQPLYTVEEAGVYLRCSVRAVQDLVSAGDLPRGQKRATQLYSRAVLDRVHRERMRLADFEAATGMKANAAYAA
jgi:hypothetical protein